MAVRDFRSTEDGEWYASAGDFAGVADRDAVIQGIGIRTRTILGEIWADESLGINYIDQILIKNPDPLVVRGIIGAEIARTPDVTNVVGAELVDRGDREASIEYQVDDVYSEDPISGQVGVP